MNIDCQYVRQLVRTKQIQPGSVEQLFVDHHVANCADCRAALDIPSLTLLVALLESQAPPRPESHPLYQPMPPRRKHVSRQLNPAPRRLRPRAPHPQRGMNADAAPMARSARKHPRRAVLSRTRWSWPYFFMIILITIVISYTVILGIRAGWATFRIWQGLGVIAQPTATLPAIDLMPTATGISNSMPTATPVSMVLPAGSDRPLTVLLLGSDRRPQENTTSRTDAVMLMRINPQTQKISLLSFPRDLIVTIPGYGAARINAAHVYGDLYPALGGGTHLATQTVSMLIKQPIDYTVLVDFDGFINIINTLGGVPVTVPKELYDAQFPTMDYKYREVYFAVGATTMDGETALTYSRIRHPDNDFERTTRQQSVIMGIGQRLQSDGALATLDDIATVTDALIGHAHTDMPRELIVALAWQMRAMDVKQITRFTFRDISYGTGDARYAMYPVAGAVERIVTKWLAQ